MLHLVEEHGEVLKVVGLEVLDLFEQFDFELFVLVNVVYGFTLDHVEEALLAV